MSNQNSKATKITPSDGSGGYANALTAAYDGWVSQAVAAPGVPGGSSPDGSSHLDFLLDFVFDGATEIELIAEHAPPVEGGGAPAAWYPLGRLNASGEIENDTAKLLAANMEVGQTSQDLYLEVPAAHWIRLRARAVGGTAPTLDATVIGGRA